MSAVDEQHLAAYQELQGQMFEQYQQRKMLESLQVQSQRRMAMAKLVASELHPLPDSARIYKAVGKAYFLNPKAEQMKDLQEQVVEQEDSIKQCKAGQEAVERKLKQIEGELRELIGSNPALAQAISSSDAA